MFLAKCCNSDNSIARGTPVADIGALPGTVGDDKNPHESVSSVLPSETRGNQRTMVNDGEQDK